MPRSIKSLPRGTMKIRPIAIFISMLVIMHASLSAQPIYVDSAGAPESRSTRPDYVYYGIEGKQTPGPSRVAVLTSAAIVAGVVTGAVFISLVSKHHHGHSSYGSGYSSIVSEELSNYDGHHHHSDYSGQFSSYDFSGYGSGSRDYSNESRHDHGSKQVIVVTEQKAKKIFSESVEKLSFTISIESTQLNAVPFVIRPNGEVIERELQANSTKIVIDNPVKGTYQAGLRNGKVANIHVKTHDVELDLDQSGLFEFN